MSVWLTEQEFRQGGAQSTGLTLNVAFLKDIKQDNPSLLKTTSQICRKLADAKLDPRGAVDCLSEYRDSLETYFTLEEFYGYFSNASVTNPLVSARADELKSEHEQLFVKLNQIVDLAEQIMYHECSAEITIGEVISSFNSFAAQFDIHEQREMELMMRLCNEELGVGD